MRPHRRQPTRLPCPWDSPGKNTEVGCHFLLQCMKVKSESEVAQLCLTCSDPMDCSPPGSSIHGIFQARVLEWGAIAFSSEDLTSVEILSCCSLVLLLLSFASLVAGGVGERHLYRWNQIECILSCFCLSSALCFETRAFVAVSLPCSLPCGFHATDYHPVVNSHSSCLQFWLQWAALL